MLEWGGCTDEKPDPQFIKHVLRAVASDPCSLHGDIQGEEKRWARPKERWCPPVCTPIPVCIYACSYM